MQLEEIYRVNIPSDINLKETSQMCGDIGDQPNQRTFGAFLYINSHMEFQEIRGLGGAFSELGGKALLALSDEDQKQVCKDIVYDKFNYFRLPIGASDFALDAYSLDDVEDDFEMESFSLERDEKYMIPYMAMCRAYAPNMGIHASPWSPPAWMKDNKQMAGAGGAGRLIDDPRYYDAYAKYFVRVVEEYANKGFDIDRINVQNEPEANPIFPGCNMDVQQMAKLIRDHMVPAFEAAELDTKIFAGTFRTINEATACEFLSENPGIEEYIEGIGTQYTTMQPLYNILQNYPGLKLMHTESVCYKGENTWEQAIALYMNIVNYINAGCDTFTYWNMILNTKGTSTWGWKQNSMVTIDEEEKTYQYNPDFYVMALAGKCIKPGARRIVYAARSKVGIAFKNVDGSIHFMVSNFLDKEDVGTVTIDQEKFELKLKPMSITAFKVS